VDPIDPAPARVDPPRPATTTTTTRASDLASQVAALDRARSALRAGDGARARRLVDDYEARYPSGAFVQEAEIVRIEALLAQGDRPAAQTAAGRFLAQYPSSPHASRVRALVAP
jgi:outer membrane protein assembly factor BamD (BamD/ComL family)